MYIRLLFLALLTVCVVTILAIINDAQENPVQIKTLNAQFVT